MTMKFSYGADNIDCGCQVKVVYTDQYGEMEVYGYEIGYCSKHKVASDMLEALKGLLEVLNAGPTEATNMDLANAVEIGYEAIAKAEGKNNE